MNDKVAIYCRVSTQMQSTDRQKEDLLKYAEERGYVISDDNIYVDVISGYKSGEVRPEYSRMIEKVKAGKINLILFSELTRLGRNATELLDEVKKFQEMGVHLYFEKQNIEVKGESDLGSKILLHILAVVAEYEIQLFSERSLSGKIEKLKKGGGGGLERAYGYKHENKLIVIDKDEAEIVKYIFEEYANGKSSLAICESLNARGIKPPYVRRLNEYQDNRKEKGLSAKEYEHFDADRMTWRASSLNRLLHNKIYKGDKEVVLHEPEPENKVCAKKRESRKEVFHYQDHDESLRIVSDELFQRVQDRLALAPYNKNNAYKHDNLLKAKLKCGECGSNFTVGKGGTERTYKCYGTVKRMDKPRTCKDGVELRQCRLDGLVLQTSLYMFAKFNMENESENRINHNLNEVKDLEDRIVHKQQELDEITKEYKRTLHRLLLLSNDEIAEQMLDENSKKFKTESTKLESDIAKLKDEIITKRNLVHNLRQLQKKYINIHDKMRDIRNSTELVKSMTDEYIDKIIIYRVHKSWALVITKYIGGQEFWGILKTARYKNDELFYDELLCRYGTEYKSWMLNNTSHCFSYDKMNRTITYNADKDKIFIHDFKSGTYSFEEFNKMVSDTGWMGSFPSYYYENEIDKKKVYEAIKKLMGLLIQIISSR